MCYYTKDLNSRSGGITGWGTKETKRSCHYSITEVDRTTTRLFSGEKINTTNDGSTPEIEKLVRGKWYEYGF